MVGSRSATGQTTRLLRPRIIFIAHGSPAANENPFCTVVEVNMADNKITKSAGEHWVCAVLSRMQWAAALTRDGIARTDILAVHDTGKHVSIQVKTTSPARSPRFMTGSKSCIPAISDGEWFVFVALDTCEWASPRAFIVPRDHVAAAVWIEHMEWLTNPTVARGKRTTRIENARTSAAAFARYEQRWDLLLAPTSEVPILLPPRFRSLARSDRVGLPNAHPWISALPEWDTTESHPDWSDWLRTDS